MEANTLLEGIGLTRGEIKVYFALLELGPSTTGEIIKKARVSRSKVYEMLDRLMDKGLASFVIKENTKYFEAADPEQVLHFIRREKSILIEKEESLKQILPVLKQKQKFGKIPQTATVYEGIKGIKTIYSDVLYSLQKGDKYCAVAAEPEVVKSEDFVYFIQNFHRRRQERDIKVRLIALPEIKDIISNTIAKTKLIQIRYSTQFIPAALLIYKDKVATYVWAKSPTGIVIRSKFIADRYRKYFEQIWKRSKS